MKQVDLEPGQYTERKPKGWRWRLPWGHPVAARTPFAGMLVMLGFLGYFLFNLPPAYSLWIVGAIAMFGFLAGAMFILAFHDN